LPKRTLFFTVDEKIPTTINIHRRIILCKSTNMVLVEHNKMIHSIELCHQTKLFHQLMFVKENSKHICEKEKLVLKVDEQTFPDPTGPITQIKSPG
jgi:hypothetical protein